MLQQVDLLEVKLREVELASSREATGREKAESKLIELNQQMETLIKAHASEAEARDNIVEEYKNRATELAQQVTMATSLYGGVGQSTGKFKYFIK